MSQIDKNGVNAFCDETFQKMKRIQEVKNEGMWLFNEKPRTEENLHIVKLYLYGK